MPTASLQLPHATPAGQGKVAHSRYHSLLEVELWPAKQALLSE